MQAQELKIDVIANNLANINTTGFKRSKVDFQDLLYQVDRSPGSTTGSSAQVPTGIQIGHGVRTGSVTKEFSQGNLVETSASPMNLDMAINGEGFFQVMLPDGTTAYSRDGSFHLDGQTGQVVTSEGYALEPAITLPQPLSAITRIDIGPDGTMDYYTNNAGAPAGSANVQLAHFMNPAGLLNIGNNLMLETEGSGPAVTGQPGLQGLGSIQHRYLERSNVQMVDEMVEMITTQRAYEINAKVIQTGDDMLGQASQLKR
jgi:flagellar basal-body rod protein FlgG